MLQDGQLVHSQTEERKSPAGLAPQGEGLTQGPRRTTAVVTSITESRYRSGSSSALWLLRYEGATETAKMEEALPRWTGDRIKVSQAFNRLQP